jgi:cell division protein FtsL
LNSKLISILLALVLLIGSALGVVYTRHESRQYSAELGVLERERDAYMAEWSRLQIEQAYLADAGQIEMHARDDLRMNEPEDIRILVVTP